MNSPKSALRRIISTAVFSFTAACTTVQSADRAPQASVSAPCDGQGLEAQARVELSAGKYEDAAKLATGAIGAERKRLGQLYRLLGDSYQRAGRKDDAEAAYAESLKLDPPQVAPAPLEPKAMPPELNGPPKKLPD